MKLRATIVLLLALILAGCGGGQALPTAPLGLPASPTAVVVGLPGTDIPTQPAQAEPSATLPAPTDAPTPSPTPRIPVPPPVAAEPDAWAISAVNMRQVELLARSGGMPSGDSAGWAVWSPDGQWFLLQGPMGVALYDTASLQPHWQGVWGRLLDFSTDSQTFAYIPREENRLQFHSVPDGAVVSSLELETFPYYYETYDSDGNLLERYYQNEWLYADTFRLSPNGQTLAGYTEYDRSLRFWSLADGHFLRAVAIPLEYDAEYMAEFAFSADGMQVFLSTSTGALYQVGVTEGKVVRKVAALGDPMAYSPIVTCYSYVAKGVALVTSCNLNIWTGPDIPPGQANYLIWTDLVAKSYRMDTVRPGEYFSVLGMSPDGQSLFVYAGDGREIWDYRTSPVTTRPVDRALPGELHLSPVEAGLALSVEGASLSLWDLSMGTSLRSAQQTYVPAVSVAVAQISEGYRVAYATCQGSITLWELPSGRQVSIPAAHTGCVNALSFSLDGRLLASAGEDEQVVLWDLSGAEAVAVLRYAHPEEVVDLALSRDGLLLVSISASQLQRWDVLGAVNLETLEMEKEGLAVTVGSDGLSIGYWDRGTINWDDGAPFAGYAGEMGQMLFNPSQSVLAMLYSDRLSAWALDPVANESLADFETDSQYATLQRLAFSADGCMLIGLTEDSGLIFWDTNTQEVLARVYYPYFAHEDGYDHSTTDGAISPDGRVIVRSVRDGMVQVWGLPGVLGAPPAGGIPADQCGVIVRPAPTPEPSQTPIAPLIPTPTPVGYSRTLYLTSPQMNGPDVLALQQRLHNLGYTEVGVLDGYFGQLTDQAVRHFQEVNGLEVDGVVGPLTWERMFGPDALPAP